MNAMCKPHADKGQEGVEGNSSVTFFELTWVIKTSATFLCNKQIQKQHDTHLETPRVEYKELES